MGTWNLESDFPDLYYPVAMSFFFFFLIQVFCTLNIYSALDKFNNFCPSLPPPQKSYKYIKMIILESDFYLLFIQDHI